MLIDIVPNLKFTDLTDIDSSLLRGSIADAQAERYTVWCKLAAVITDQQWSDLIVGCAGFRDPTIQPPDPLQVSYYEAAFGRLNVLRFGGYTFLVDTALIADIHKASEWLACVEIIAFMKGLQENR